MEDLAGRSAVVTGAASGIGRALASALAAEGMRVVVSDVERDALETAAEELRAAGAEAWPIPADVADPAQVRALAARSHEALGALHVVCHNAGVFAGGLAWEASADDYAWVFDVNVWGVVHGVRHFTPLQLAHGEPGRVVITASMAALTCTPWNAPYTMSKHAVLGLAESLHMDLGARGAPVGVSVLCPELVRTGIGRSDRNRPAHRERGAAHPERELVEKALAESTAGGLDPAEIAARTVSAIREERFYVLPPEGDTWRAACRARLDAIAKQRNPGLEVDP